MIEIKDYLNAIRRKFYLKKNISTTVIDEILENLEDQIETRKEEMSEKYTDLSTDQIYEKIISELESVDVFVDRVDKEINREDLPFKKVDQPSQEFLHNIYGRSMNLFKYILMDSQSAFQKIVIQFGWSGNPIINSFYLLGIFFLTIFLELLYLAIIPWIYICTRDSTGEVYLAIGDDVNSTTLVIISHYIALFSFLIILGLLFIHLSYKKSFRNSLLTAFYTVFNLFVLFILLVQPSRLYSISNRGISSGHIGFNPHWYRSYIPTVTEYNAEVILGIVTIFSFISSIFVLYVVIGSLIKSTRKRHSYKVILGKTIMITICLLGLVLPFFIAHQYENPSNTPIPDDSYYYSVGFPWDEYYKDKYTNNEVNSNIEFLGNISFTRSGIYKAKFNSVYVNFSTLDIGDDYNGSQYSITAEGLFTFPNNFRNLNSSFPFASLTPILNSSYSSLIIYENIVPVNTIHYNDRDNNYTFHFDIETNHLIQATLISNVSWVQNREIYTLNIRRMFLYTNIPDLSIYPDYNPLFSGLALVSLVIVYSFSFYYYLIYRK